MNKHLNKLIGIMIIMELLAGLHAQAKNSAYQKLGTQIDTIRNAHGVAAAAVILVSKDQILINDHFGVRDWSTGATFNSNDMYRIGSISKTFAGILALRLEAKGLIKLDGLTSDYGLDPYLKNTYPEQSITLAQLLEHTAGLSDLKKQEWDYNSSELMDLKTAFDLKLGNHQTLWSPGMHRSYSNVGPGLFGLALENKLNTSYEELMQQHVFDPTGMTQSSLLLGKKTKEQLIAGYDKDGTTPIPYWHNIYRPFAAINTNSQDLIHWLQMLLNQDNTFLSLNERKRLVEPSTSLAARSGLRFGYGLGIYQWQTGGYSFFGHGGDADGYLTRFGFNRESGLAYFVMINAFKHQPLNEMVEHIEQFIIQYLPKPDYPLRLKLKPPQLNTLVGTYRQVTQRFSANSNTSKKYLIITLEGDYLAYSIGNRSKIKLYPVEQDLFRTVNQSVATMAFSKLGGDLYFQTDQGISWKKIHD
ncbi:MAG: serine hydrolase domain-containing protein [Marinicella sp.]